jgi:hypothetical protein
MGQSIPKLGIAAETDTWAINHASSGRKGSLLLARSSIWPSHSC